MPRHRPAALLFALLFAFQLLLAGGNGACAMWDHSRAEAPGDAMAMAMAGMPMDESSSATPEAPCDHPASGSQQQQCQTMAPCAAGFLAPQSALAMTPASAPSAVLVALVIMPPSATVAPEIRPPRA